MPRCNSHFGLACGDALTPARPHICLPALEIASHTGPSQPLFHTPTISSHDWAHNALQLQTSPRIHSISPLFCLRCSQLSILYRENARRGVVKHRQNHARMTLFRKTSPVLSEYFLFGYYLGKVCSSNARRLPHSSPILVFRKECPQGPLCWAGSPQYVASRTCIRNLDDRRGRIIVPRLSATDKPVPSEGTGPGT